MALTHKDMVHVRMLPEDMALIMKTACIEYLVSTGEESITIDELTAMPPADLIATMGWEMVKETDAQGVETDVRYFNVVFMNSFPGVEVVVDPAP